MTQGRDKQVLISLLFQQSCWIDRAVLLFESIRAASESSPIIQSALGPHLEALLSSVPKAETRHDD